MEPREDGGKRVIASVNVTWDIVKNLKLRLREITTMPIKRMNKDIGPGSNTTNVSPNGHGITGSIKT